MLFVHSQGIRATTPRAARWRGCRDRGRTGAYLGETRRQFILSSGPLARPLGAVRRGLHRHREKLRLALRLSAAGLAISAWGIFLVAPDWRLQRLIGELQSPDGGVSWGAAIELTQLEELETGFLSQERNRMLLAILREGRAAERRQCDVGAGQLGPAGGRRHAKFDRTIGLVKCKSPRPERGGAWVLGTAAAPAVPKIITLLHDSDDDVRRLAVWTLMELAAPEAIPELAAILADPDSDLHANAINALGSIRARPEVCRSRRVAWRVPADRGFRAISPSASYALVGFGPDAAPAIPVLERELECRNLKRLSAKTAIVGDRRCGGPIPTTVVPSDPHAQPAPGMQIVAADGTG